MQASAASAPTFAQAGLPQPTLKELYLNWPTFSGFVLLTTIFTLYVFAVRFLKTWLRGVPLVGKVVNNFNVFAATCVRISV